MLLSPDSVTVATSSLLPEDFYDRWHRSVFETMLKLVEDRNTIDPTILWHALDRGGLTGKTDEIKRSEQASLVSMTTHACMQGDLPTHVKLVKSLSTHRQLIAAASELTEMGYAANDDSKEALRKAEQLLAQISSGIKSDSSSSVGETFSSLMHSSSDLWLTGSEISGLTTGFPALDKIVLGLKPGSVNIIAGRPGMGKSVLAQNIAAHVALDLGRAVALHTLEMNRTEVTRRFTAAAANLHQSHYTAGRLSNRNWAAIRESAVDFSQAQLVIDDDSSTTVAQIATKAKRLNAETNGNLGLIVVDYIGLMAGGGSASEKQSEISKISRDLKILANELQVAIILVAQVGRGLESRADKRPRMSDLRDSGSLEQDASVVMFVYRDEKYFDVGTEQPLEFAGKYPRVMEGLAEIIVDKNRDAGTGTAFLAFSGEMAKFMNLSTDV